MRKNSRSTGHIRPVKITPDFCPAATGSVLFELGATRVICAATASGVVPSHAESRGWGWVTGEYTMLPYSTSPRTRRDQFRKDGRAVEIQRLLGRALRSAVDLPRLKEWCITVDCDVLEAYGGTRSASITGGYIAMKRAVKRMLDDGLLEENPIVDAVAAVSLGIVDGELMLDLDYNEDSRAEVDMNVVMDGSFRLVEIQGSAERRSFSKERLDEMLALAQTGIEELLEIQKAY